jgi:hypothetical protein
VIDAAGIPGLPKLDIRLSSLWSTLSARRGALFLTLLGALACAFTIYLVAPGYLGMDSAVQLDNARKFELYDGHPVLIALIWRYTDKVLPGPLGMLVLMTCMYWSGLSLLFWALRASLFARALGLLAVGFFPPVFSSVPMIIKDMLMQAALVLGFALLVAPLRAPRVRYALGLGVLVVGLGARHNAAAALWPLLAWPLLRMPVPRRRLARLLLAGGGGLVLTLALTLALTRALKPISIPEESWQKIHMFDLAGMSLQTGQLLIEPESGVFTNGMKLRELRQRFEPQYTLTLLHCLPYRKQGCAPAFRITLDPKELELLEDNWRRAILEHPGAYVAHRITVALPLLGVFNGPSGIFYSGGSPHHPLGAEYPVPKRSLMIMGWIEGHMGAFWFRPWFYVALSTALLPIALARFLRGRCVLPLLFLLSGLSYLLSVVLTTGSSEYRYCVWTILCTVLALITSFAPLERPALLPPQGRRESAKSST